MQEWDEKFRNAPNYYQSIKKIQIREATKPRTLTITHLDYYLLLQKSEPTISMHKDIRRIHKRLYHKTHMPFEQLWYSFGIV